MKKLSLDVDKIIRLNIRCDIVEQIKAAVCEIYGDCPFDIRIDKPKIKGRGDFTTNMRTIKFRAWDKYREEMIPWWALRRQGYNHEHESVKDTDGHGRHNDIYKDDDHILMQYTECKDRDGVEIYDGDIIEKRPWNGVVGWKEKFRAWGFKDEITPWAWDFYEYGNGPDSDGRIKTWKVIGNVWENPELLEGK